MTYTNNFLCKLFEYAQPAARTVHHCRTKGEAVYLRQELNYWRAHSRKTEGCTIYDNLTLYIHAHDNTVIVFEQHV